MKWFTRDRATFSRIFFFSKSKSTSEGNSLNGAFFSPPHNMVIFKSIPYTAEIQFVEFHLEFCVVLNLMTTSTLQGHGGSNNPHDNS